ncbi:response regulator [Coraliomargarita sp. SDUM461004]|uniref:Response regulator n=1 Tax=Thalassobacterium sedimentorum TaxID=3041258 RepID=A0ABU1AJG3_9BACT|nr:response regulator [Coraliomargarita sp. SDUM461004]MDQ8194926.1 response regulator [Coraliomargarita sp. SDUM461004]
MPYSVLILDDDADFNSLLTDIFEQADYVVTSLTDPIEAVDVFRDTDYDLVVTDHKMPEMTGAEYMKVIKQLKPEVPVIMVSGYLENDTIRELISEGVGGVFLKPLNIFSLLERTAELIEEAKKLESAPAGGIEDGLGSDVSAKLGFAFRSYPCKSGASAAFAERLYSLRNFKSTLSLIGEPGMHYRSICEDIQGFYESSAEQFIFLSASAFDQEQALTLIDAAKRAGAERVTCVLLELETMSAAQKTLATALSKHEGVFEDIGVSLRTIFCVSGDLDSLFDEGLIDENLYILMGTAEVRVPPLRECQVDVGVMAQQLVVEVAREQALASVPRFERSARDLFRQHKWERNFEELRQIVRQIVEEHPGDVITHATVKSALQVTEGASQRTLFESHLSSQQVDYLRAVAILFGGDRSQTASFFGTDVISIEAKMK